MRSSHDRVRNSAIVISREWFRSSRNARFISLPLTLMSFGLFALVVNGALFALTAWLVDALTVDNFLWAIVGALVLTVVTWILSLITGRAAARSRRD